jgi:hypothetical protein
MQSQRSAVQMTSSLYQWMRVIRFDLIVVLWDKLVNSHKLRHTVSNTGTLPIWVLDWACTECYVRLNF